MTTEGEQGKVARGAEKVGQSAGRCGNAVKCARKWRRVRERSEVCEKVVKHMGKCGESAGKRSKSTGKCRKAGNA